MATILHDSDCAVHNEPAMPNGPCDCGADEVPKLLADIEAAALRNSGPLARDHCEDQLRTIGLFAQKAR